MMKELRDNKDKILALEKTLIELDKKIDSHVCIVVVPEDPQNPTNRLN